MQIPLFQHAVLPPKKLLLGTIFGYWVHYVRSCMAYILMIYKDLTGRKLFRTVVRLRRNNGISYFSNVVYRR